MARSSKPAPFAIYEDVRLSGPQDSAIGIIDNEDGCDGLGDKETESGIVERTADLTDGEEAALHMETTPILEQEVETDGDADDERRESMRSRTSVSSVPESTWNADIEKSIPTHPPYTPPVMRPSFMRAESVRRMQMASPPPFGSRSPRRSVVRTSMSRNGTPRSVRSATAKGSPRPRRVVSEDSGTEPEAVKEYPLVLLHVTILPQSIPWSQESMLELLPEATRENMDLLRTKISETVLQRGVLIPHPRHEYELLEERLLEALELRQERVTKCGHFRNRLSTSSESSDNLSGRDSDSGMGSSIDGDSRSAKQCSTCRHHIKDAKNGVDRKWAIEVYASNGLMRSSAWTAVWNDMERVDVRITPFISEDIRKQLSERRDAESERAKAIMTKSTPKKQASERAVTRPSEVSPLSFFYQPAVLSPPKEGENTSASPTPPQTRELPKIYKQTSDVPITLLLKNYLALLAQDPKNIAIFFLVLGLVMIAVRPSSSATQTLDLSTPIDNNSMPVVHTPDLQANASILLDQVVMDVVEEHILPLQPEIVEVEAVEQSAAVEEPYQEIGHIGLP